MPLRRIAPLKILEQYLPPKDLGQRPTWEWVSPTDLYVEDVYQRELTRSSITQLRKTVTTFAWSKMKPIIAVRANGKLEVIDGQHTAIAAATIRLPEVPVFIVGAEQLHERARSFVSHNTDRVKVSPFAIYRAMLAAGDPEALSMQATLDRAGVRVRAMNQSMEAVAGDCAAIGAVQAMMKVHGPLRSRIVLETLRKADRIPITSDEIKAATHMLWVREERIIDPDRLTAVIAALGNAGLEAAHSRAKVARTQVWRELVRRWSEKIDVSKAA